MKALLIPAFIFLLSCKSKENSKGMSEIKSGHSTSSVMADDPHDVVLDTLNKYRKLNSLVTSFMCEGDLRDFLYMIKLGDQKFALHCILMNGTTRYYALINEQWQLQDTLNVPANNYSNCSRIFKRKENTWIWILNYYDRPELRMRPKYEPSKNKVRLTILTIPRTN